MRQTSFAGMHCSLARSLEIVGDWWSPLILRDLFLGLDRSTVRPLVADLDIARNLLRDRLDVLEAGGVVAKQRYQENPVRSRYVLTDAGAELVPVLLALTAWGDWWVTPDGGPPLMLLHRDCGPTVPVVTCSTCGDPLTAESVFASNRPGRRSSARHSPARARPQPVLRSQPDRAAGESTQVDSGSGLYHWSPAPKP